MRTNWGKEISQKIRRRSWVFKTGGSASAIQESTRSEKAGMYLQKSEGK